MVMDREGAHEPTTTVTEGKGQPILVVEQIDDEGDISDRLQGLERAVRERRRIAGPSLTRTRP